jgi:hypothetical protein
MEPDMEPIMTMLPGALRSIKHGQVDNLVTSAGFTENFEAINYPFDRMQKLWGVVVRSLGLGNINDGAGHGADHDYATGRLALDQVLGGFTENFEAINYPFDRMQKLWGVNVDGTYLFAINVAMASKFSVKPAEVTRLSTWPCLARTSAMAAFTESCGASMWMAHTSSLSMSPST